MTASATLVGTSTENMCGRFTYAKSSRVHDMCGVHYGLRCAIHEALSCPLLALSGHDAWRTDANATNIID